MISNADREKEREKERYKDIFHIVFFFFFSMMVRGLLRGLLRLALDSLRPVSVPFVVVVVVDVAVVRTAAVAALSGHLARINVHEHALFGRAWNFDDLRPAEGKREMGGAINSLDDVRVCGPDCSMQMLTWRGGKRASNLPTLVGSIFSGNLTENWMMRRPLS